MSSLSLVDIAIFRDFHPANLRDFFSTLLAYPLGLKGVVVGEGNTYEEALADVRSAVMFHIETFGPEVVESGSPILEAFVAEAGVMV